MAAAATASLVESSRRLGSAATAAAARSWSSAVGTPTPPTELLATALNSSSRSDEGFVVVDIRWLLDRMSLEEEEVGVMGWFMGAAGWWISSYREDEASGIWDVVMRRLPLKEAVPP